MILLFLTVRKKVKVLGWFDRLRWSKKEEGMRKAMEVRRAVNQGGLGASLPLLTAPAQGLRSYVWPGCVHPLVLWEAGVRIVYLTWIFLPRGLLEVLIFFLGLFHFAVRNHVRLTFPSFLNHSIIQWLRFFPVSITGNIAEPLVCSPSWTFLLHSEGNSTLCLPDSPPFQARKLLS